MKKVYLAGPITGTTYGTSVDWRNDVQTRLERKGIAGYSPMRAKEFLAGLGVLEDQYYDLHPLSTPRGIITRDRWDVATCDLMLVNLVGATRVSIGTVWEIGQADAHRKPMVIAMEDAGNVHDHSFVRESAGFVVPTLAEAVNIVEAILLP